MNTPTYISGILQAKAYRILRTCVSEALLQFDLSIPEWNILGQVLENPDGIRLTTIADILDVEPPLVTTLVDKLEKKSLLILQSHPQDKRAKLIFLTDKGRKIMSPVEKQVRTMLSKLLQGVTQQDLIAYSKVLNTIINNSHK